MLEDHRRQLVYEVQVKPRDQRGDYAKERNPSALFVNMVN
jgi:hypothetical protein